MRCPTCGQPWAGECRGCGAPLEQPKTGRARKWCERKACQVKRREGKRRPLPPA